ncbi:hypothetical protein HU200_039981 [Digitaria exilis]|uniref:F-box domain-containing protein n=1 Tax=Digitaria exilis TaxID=1010633 RepID=A0A835EH02_9POAL|nr:hypothetical protein HU200_039981 [Digitaria exilis]
MASDRLSDDMVSEILVRLPAADAVCSRAVCRAWRRIAGSAAFLGAHARRQPLELILRDDGGWLHTATLAALGDTWRWKRRHLPRLQGCQLVGACGGLLLLEMYPYGHDHVVFNPATRQCVSLPRTPSLLVRICGLYIHGPSGEHRLLYLADDDRSSVQPGRRTASHRVLSLGDTGEARWIGPPVAAIEMWTQMPEAYLQHRGKLHWLHHPEVHDTDAILAFDTVSETIRRIPRPPPVRSQSRSDDLLYEPPCFLVEAHGNLAVMAVVEGCMYLCVMEDYNSDSSWRRHLQVSMSSPLRSACWAVNASDVGKDVILLEDGCAELVVLYDLAERKVLKQVELKRSDTRLAYFVLRDSLERHGFFDVPLSPTSFQG